MGIRRRRHVRGGEGERGGRGEEEGEEEEKRVRGSEEEMAG